MAWCLHLLLALALGCWLVDCQTTPGSFQSTEATLPAGCSAVPQPGRRLDLDAPGLTVLANVSSSTAAGCPQLCCGRPGCRLAARDGDSCVLLSCGREGCGALPTRHRGHRQKLWLISWEETGDAAEAPAAAALKDR